VTRHAQSSVCTVSYTVAVFVILACMNLTAKIGVTAVSYCWTTVALFISLFCLTFLSLSHYWFT